MSGRKLHPRVRLREERGLTLVEMMVTLSILGVVITTFLAVLFSIQTALVREQSRTNNVDQARLAVEELDREIRSGSVLYVAYDSTKSCPSSANTGYEMCVYTQANAPTRNGGNAMCVQYRISNSSLFRRMWPSGSTSSVTAWRDVADGIVNSASGVPAFQLDSSTYEGGSSTLGSRVVDITLLVNTKTSDTHSSTVRLLSSVEIRNQTSGNPCSPTPAG